MNLLAGSRHSGLLVLVKSEAIDAQRLLEGQALAGASPNVSSCCKLHVSLRQKVICVT